jgi:hypothetical protein
MAKSYKGIAKYGNHLRAIAWLRTSNMITYDLGVIGEFEHTSFALRGNPTPTLEQICYIGECKKILELDYGLAKVIVLLYSWV